MLAQLNPHASDFRDISALYPPFLHCLPSYINMSKHGQNPITDCPSHVGNGNQDKRVHHIKALRLAKCSRHSPSPEAGDDQRLLAPGSTGTERMAVVNCSGSDMCVTVSQVVGTSPACKRPRARIVWSSWGEQSHGGGIHMGCQAKGQMGAG